NMKQLGIATHNYASANQNRFPWGSKLNNQLSWICYLLPYLEENTMYDEMQRLNAFKDGTVSGGTNNEGDSIPAGAEPHKGLYFAAKYEIKALHCPEKAADFFDTHSGKGQDPPSAAGASGQLNDYTYAWNSHYLGVQGPLGINPSTLVQYKK